MTTSKTFSIVCAVNDHNILQQCLLRSSIVSDNEIRPTIIVGASNMSSAYNHGMDISPADYYIFCHQDVYLPNGWLPLLQQRIDELETFDPHWGIIGPYGVQKNGRHVGRVWDTGLRRELGEGGFRFQPVTSLDELLFVVKGSTGHRFDEDLPDFHLYGTDAVLALKQRGYSAYAAELPLIHNSRPVASLRGGYQDAYRYCVRKWTAELPVPTPCATLARNPAYLWRKQWRRRHVPPRISSELPNPQAIAIELGYE